MSYNAKHQPRLVEMIFEGRNKAYGAYQLRLQYGVTMLKSIGMVMGGTVLFSLLLAWVLRQTVQIDIPNIQIIDSLYSIIVEMPPPETPVKKAGGTPTPPETPVENQDNKIVPVIQDTLTSEKPVTDNQSASNTNSAPATGSVVSDGAGTGGNNAGIDTAGRNTPIESYVLDELPEFEGGMAGISRFIRNTVRYPEAAMERNKTGTVYVRFVVDEKGEVSQVTTRNKLGFGLEEEAARVVKKMPAFKKPGKINGLPVKVYFDLPIKFALD